MQHKKKATTGTEIEIIRIQLEVHGVVLSRLVNELYSNIGQMMSSTKMLIGITERKWTPPPETLLEAHETIARAIEDLRDLCRPLSNNWLADFLFVEQLTAELICINQDHPGLVVCTKMQLPEKLSTACQLILFSIVQEAVYNALKHAFAKKIEITVVYNTQTLSLSVSDNGAGFCHSPELIIGRGMRNMQLRAALLGGTIEWKSSGQVKGSLVILQVPIINHQTVFTWPSP